MPNFVPSKRQLERGSRAVRHIIARTGIQCAFCYSTHMDRTTMTCNDCNTTAPGNYGSAQRRDTHGKPLKGVKQ